MRDALPWHFYAGDHGGEYNVMSATGFVMCRVSDPSDADALRRARRIVEAVNGFEGCGATHMTELGLVKCELENGHPGCHFRKTETLLSSWNS